MFVPVNGATTAWLGSVMLNGAWDIEDGMTCQIAASKSPCALVNVAGSPMRVAIFCRVVVQVWTIEH